MDKRIVGVNAGNVWHVLNEVKRISIPELARKLNLSVESTALAVGWLARENKVCIHRVNGLIEVCDENQFGFMFVLLWREIGAGKMFRFPSVFIW